MSAGKPFLFWFIVDLVEQGLDIGLEAPQGKEVDGLGIQIDLTADQAMSPGRLNVEAMAQKTDLALFVGTADVDYASTVQGRSVIPAPLSWEVHACWGGLDSSDRSSAMGLNVA